jgi:hypothetical protein
MKTYGKEPESLDSIIDLFIETLAGFPWDEINCAMTEHAKVSPEFPTPAEIVAIIKLERAEKTRSENSIVFGVDDTIEMLRSYRQKAEQKLPLRPKEARLLREYGWKLDVSRRAGR